MPHRSRAYHSEENDRAKCRKIITRLRTKIVDEGGDADIVAPLSLVLDLSAEQALRFEQDLDEQLQTGAPIASTASQPPQHLQATYTTPTPSPPLSSFYDPQAGMDPAYAMQQQHHSNGQMAFPNGGMLASSQQGGGQPMVSQPPPQPTQTMMPHPTQFMMPQPQATQAMVPQPVQPVERHSTQSLMPQSAHSQQTMMAQPSQPMMPQSPINMTNPAMFQPPNFDYSQFYHQSAAPADNGLHAMYNPAPQGFYQAPPHNFTTTPGFMPTHNSGLQTPVGTNTPSSASAGLSRHSSANSLHAMEHHAVQSSPEYASSNNSIDHAGYGHSFAQAVDDAAVQSQDSPLHPASEVSQAFQHDLDQQQPASHASQPALVPTEAEMEALLDVSGDVGVLEHDQNPCSSEVVSGANNNSALPPDDVETYGPTSTDLIAQDFGYDINFARDFLS